MKFATNLFCQLCLFVLIATMCILSLAMVCFMAFVLPFHWVACLLKAVTNFVLEGLATIVHWLESGI